MKKLLFATCCIAFLSGSLGAAAQKKSAAKNVLTQTLKGKDLGRQIMVMVPLQTLCFMMSFLTLILSE